MHVKTKSQVNIVAGRLLRSAWKIPSLVLKHSNTADTRQSSSNSQLPSDENDNVIYEGVPVYHNFLGLSDFQGLPCNQDYTGYTKENYPYQANTGDDYIGYQGYSDQNEKGYIDQINPCVSDLSLNYNPVYVTGESSYLNTNYETGLSEAQEQTHDTKGKGKKKRKMSFDMSEIRNDKGKQQIEQEYSKSLDLEKASDLKKTEKHYFYKVLGKSHQTRQACDECRKDDLRKLVNTKCAGCNVFICKNCHKEKHQLDSLPTFMTKFNTDQFCIHCGENLGMETRSLVQHSRDCLKIERGPRSFYGCFKCKETFSTDYHCERHIMTHIGELPHRCRYCNFAAKSRKILGDHMVLEHTRYVNLSIN